MTFRDGVVIVLIFVAIFILSAFSFVRHCVDVRRGPYSLP